MKYIFLNLKRFDVPRELGGVNSILPLKDWAFYIINETQEKLKEYSALDVELVMFFPEAHLINAVGALCGSGPLKIGSQGVFRDDTAVGGNFGTFTTNRTANAVRAIGCVYTIIGHCEERKDKLEIMQEAGVTDNDAVNRLLNREIKCAVNAGLKVLYCIGETISEQTNWQNTLKKQIETGLDSVDINKVIIAYEPVWAIGPGKTPPDKDFIQMKARFIKELTNDAHVVYGGGLKKENAKMLASIAEIDGGLIALTRFSGDIGFYPCEYLEIIQNFLNCDV